MDDDIFSNTIPKCGDKSYLKVPSENFDYEYVTE